MSTAAPAFVPSALIGRDAVRAIDETLTSRSLIFVTGKGGVGKSGVAAALALRARTLGLTPLLFECDAPPRPSLFPGGQPVTDTLGEVVPGVLAVNQDSEEAVKAYAQAALPAKAIAEMLFENRVARLFLRASPSVNEMALIGRVVQLVESHEENGPVIVDLHATGHALRVLTAPDGIMRVLRAGPVYDRAAYVKGVVFDKSRTTVVTVALPEELPVTELLEFHDQLTDIDVPLGLVFANGVFEDPAPQIPDAVLKHLAGASNSAAAAVRDLASLRAWSKRASRERDRLAEGVGASGGTVVSIPYVCDLAPAETLAGRISDLIDEAAAGGGS